MKKTILILIGGISFAGYSQVISEDEFRMKVTRAQEEIQGAHQNVIRAINEKFAGSVWRKEIRLNEADIIRFVQTTSGEKVSAGVDLSNPAGNSWVYEFDQQEATELLKEKGVEVITSFNNLLIKANQTLVYIEHTDEGKKTLLELYCPAREVLEKIRTGRQQTIDFLITGYRGSLSGNSRITGILTQVHTEKQVVQCASGHEFDKALGYQYCPKCGQPLE
jgi:hypothetical protein